GVPGAAARRHRTPGHRRAAARGPGGHLPLPRLRGGAVPLDHQVRGALRLAELLPAHRVRRRGADRGPQPGHGAHGGALPPVRLAPGPRLRRRPADPDRRPVLHELGLALLRTRRAGLVRRGRLIRPGRLRRRWGRCGCRGRVTRVLTLNLRHGVLGGTGTVATAEELADTLAPLRAEAPDVVAVQEVDRGQLRSGHLDQAQIVAEALGLPHVRFAAAIAGDLHGVRRAPQRSGHHPGPAYGVAIASRYPVLASFVRSLPGLAALPRRLRDRRRLAAADEPRVLLAAVLATPVGTLSVACTHLSTFPPLAIAQL